MEPITFITSLLTFYLKGEIKQEANFLSLKIPNTFLAFIPLGKRRETVPINQIASVETTFRFSFKKFLAGLFFLALAFLALVEKGGLLYFPIFLILAANGILSSLQTYLFIQTTSGDIKWVLFCIFEKSKAELAANRLLNIISYKMDEANRNTDRLMNQNDANTDKLINAIKDNKS